MNVCKWTNFLRVLAAVVLASGVSGAAQAKEIIDQTPLRLGQDWEASARWEWDDASKQLMGPQLHAWAEAHPSRFFEANIQNTLAQRPGEYETVGQRHSYYDYMAYYLEYSSAAPDATRGVRFFAATTSVTIRAELGLLDYIDPHATGDVGAKLREIATKLVVSVDSIHALMGINQLLLEKNMRVMRDLIQTWRAPRDPRAAAPRDTMTAFDFDMAMVDFEQSAVQGYLDSNSVSGREAAEITKILKRVESNPLSIVAQTQKWAKKAGHSEIDFGDKGWRVAIGRALVFFFHEKSEAEYLTYMRANPVAKNPRTGLYDGMQSPLNYSIEAEGYFTVLGSWKTQRGAMRHLAELKGEQSGLQAAVFPPRAPNRYWTVMGSSYVKRRTASELARRVQNMGLSDDAFITKRKAVGSDGVLQRPVASSVDVFVPGNLVDIVAPNIGTAVDQVHTRFLSIQQGATLDEVRTTYAYYKTTFPDLQVSIYNVSGAYHVLLASFATEAEVERARRAARHAGVATESLQEFSATASEHIQRINAQGQPYKGAWEEVQACYSAGLKGDGAISAAELHDCTGMWFTPTTLTRCFMQDNCEGLGDDVLRTMDQVRAFYEGQQLDYDTLVLKVASEAIPLPKDSTIFVTAVVNCRNSNGGNPTSFMTCVTKQMPNAVATGTALSCMQEGKSVEQVMNCFVQSNVLPAEVASKLDCFTADYVDDTKVARCLLGPVEQAKLDAAATCLKGASGEGAALTNCLGGLLSAEDKQKAECLASSSGQAADTVSCLLPTGGAREAVDAFRCASTPDTTTQQAAQCAALLVGGDSAMVAACATGAATAEDALTCMLKNSPEASAAHQAYVCASSGTSVADLIANCTGDSLDPKTKAIAACVANGNSDDFTTAVASCAASSILPPEIADAVGCAARSTGGVDAALCVAAPQMNAEMRIAMECASSTGGEPISFAGCTAGRLTAKELELCLSGKIGGPGGCFGDGNTLVIALGNIANDLQHGPGPNNEYVKAARALELVVQQVGEELGDAWDDLFGPNSDFCRGDLTSWACPGESSDWCRGDLTGWTC